MHFMKRRVRHSIRAAAYGLLLVLSVSASGAEFPKDLKIAGNGVMNLPGLTFGILHFAPGWIPSGQNQLLNASFIKKESGAVEVKGILGRSGFQFEQTVTPLTSDTFAYRSRVSSAHRVPTTRIGLEFQIPVAVRTVWVDGVSKSLPETYRRNVPALPWTDCRRLVISMPDGSKLIFRGSLAVRFIDERRIGSPVFTVVLRMLPEGGTDKDPGNLTRASLQFTLQRDVMKSTPVSLASAANMGFADETPGDGRGGWTDQGPENDLRMMKPGKLSVGTLVFDIADPAGNHGRAVILLGREFPRTAAVPATGGGRHLFLLHASAWHAPGVHGAVTVHYADGSRETFRLEHGRDIANWHMPGPIPNGLIAYSVDVGSRTVGLFCSQFALKRNDPVRLTFEQINAQAQWLIVAASLGNRPLLFNAFAGTHILKAGREFAPLNAPQMIRKNSILDFSGQLHAPAGKYGRLAVSPEGHFTFAGAPERRVRFIGTNFCGYACFPSHRQADEMAETIARLGYNSVRIHHHDAHMVKKGSFPLELDPVSMDKLDYFFAALKKRGIYIVSDLYTSRPLSEQDRIPEWLPPSDGNDMKILLPISPAAERSWKSFVSLWMNHPNPYTGLTWSEDPAFAFATMVNENNLYHRMRNSGKFDALYAARFPEWMRTRHPGEPVGAAEQTSRRYLEFLFDMQTKSRLRMLDFLRRELKLNILLTDGNQNELVPITNDRTRMDFVDNHSYMDHPSFPVRAWKMPMQFNQNSSLGQFRKGTLFAPFDVAATRIFGKPFTVTEFNYCSPNRYRSEMGPLFGGLAALQDWDGLWRFQHACWYPETWKQSGPITVFDADNDPLALLSDKLMMLLFRRGDLAPADQKIAYRVSPQFWNTDEPLNYPLEFKRLAIFAQIGSVSGKIPANAKFHTANLRLPQLRSFRVDSARKCLTITTPKTETVTLEHGSAAANLLSVSGAKHPQTVAASSFDGKPLAESRRILLLHLPEVFSNGAEFTDGSLHRQEKYGTRGLLIRRAPVRVSLKIDGGPTPAVEALTFSGEPVGKVESRFESGVLTFSADPACFSGGVMLYRITRE